MIKAYQAKNDSFGIKTSRKGFHELFQKMKNSNTASIRKKKNHERVSGTQNVGIKFCTPLG